jgi:nicotinate-nucleotide adenylyltransferase
MSTKYKNLEPEWVFFGGTFDPPHAGHMQAVRFARSRFPDAEIVLVPSFAPPVSKDEVKTVHASFPDRVAMCVVAFDEWEHVQVSSLEEDLEAPSYTIKTLRDLRGEYPTARLAWMIGADQLQHFTSWLEPKAILELASLVVVPRPDQAKTDLIDKAAQVATSLGFKVSIDRSEGVILLDGAGVIYILNDAPANISSSAVRQAVANGGVGALNDSVDANIAAYIEDLELYSNQDL